MYHRAMKLRFVALIMASLLTMPTVYAASVGEKGPAVELTDAEGKKAVVNGLKGEVTLVNFWASWCGPCALEFPALNELAADYTGKDFKVLAITVDTDRAAADEFLARFKKEGLKLNVLYDPESKSIDAYGARAMPTSFIIDQKGIIRYIHVGFRPDDPEKWRKEVDELLKEKK
jgi:thiol-disulfide isomerase/thioredoxin